MGSVTLGERLTLADNRPSGFDYLRLILATLVIVAHSFVVSYGANSNLALADSPLRSPFAMILPAFFALSGFLVSGSLQRSSSVVSFLGLRLIRLVPALAVETTLSALVLGPIFTVLALHDYFGSHVFFSYFQNILGHVHMQLPGVFGGLPLPNIVNIQLWTLPFELLCYVSLVGLALIGIFRRPRVFAALVVGFELIEIVRKTVFMPTPSTSITVGGPALVFSFLFGVVLYLHRDRVPYSRMVFFVCLAACLLLGRFSLTTFMMPLPAAYVTAYLGLASPPRIKMLLHGDYSYGLFLYGFPIQQAVCSVFANHREWYFNLAISLSLAAILAVSSWWLIEKPVHDRRKVIYRIDGYVTTWLNNSSITARLRKHRALASR